MNYTIQAPRQPGDAAVILCEHDNGSLSSIPMDPDNRDYAEYLEWTAKGNVAPAQDVPIAPDPVPTIKDVQAKLAAVQEQVADLADQVATLAKKG